MFHHTRDAIEAHLTIVFAALAVARHLQEVTGLSVRKIVQTLRPLQQITVRIAGHEHTAEDPRRAEGHEEGLRRADKRDAYGDADWQPPGGVPKHARGRATA